MDDSNLGKQIKKAPQSVRIMHYACSDINSNPVEISCVSIMDYSNLNTVTYSRSNLTESQLLQQFLSDLQSNVNKTYVGWNMKDSTYGLPVIYRRATQLLETTQFPLDPSAVKDLDGLFDSKYGKGYCENLKLGKMAQFNNIQMLNFLSGAEEATLAAAREFRPIEISTNRKVRIIGELLSLYIRKKLGVPHVSNRRKLLNLLEDQKAGTILTMFGIIVAVILYLLTT